MSDRKYAVSLGLGVLAATLSIPMAFSQPRVTPEEQAYGNTIVELTQKGVSLLAQIYRDQAEISELKKKIPVETPPAKPQDPTPPTPLSTDGTLNLTPSNVVPK